MGDEDWTWVDMRWRESGWKEAFRLRLFGWLPESWIEPGVRSGALIKRNETPPGTISLTSRGQSLTHLCPDRTTADSLQFLGSVIAVIGFKPVSVRARGVISAPSKV